MPEDDKHAAATRAFGELVEVIRRLRAPGGCPWDREQNPATLKPFIIEESYEVIDAIDGGDPAELREELGDLLLQIMLQAQIAKEAERFDIADVVRGLTEKMIGRHPHVFGDTAVSGSGEVLVNWEKLKREEKRGRGLFDGLPAELPGLLRAARMGEKAGRVGFDWSDADAVRAKVVEELAEVDAAVAADDPAAIERELGDLLFAVAQWSRHLGRAPEEALRAACARFGARFTELSALVRESGREIAECDAEELEQLWQQVKSRNDE